MTFPITSTCPVCGRAFVYRSNKRVCSATCRKAQHREKDRRENPANASCSPSVRREQAEVFDLAMRLAETLYSLPPSRRLGYIEGLVQIARNGEHPKLRKVLTNPHLVKPNPVEKHLFWRRSHAYCTIAQAANRYCLSSPWGASVQDVVRGKTPDPPTGEVFEHLTRAA